MEHKPEYEQRELELEDQLGEIQLYMPCVEKPSNKECCHFVRSKGCRLRTKDNPLIKIAWIKPNGHCSRFCKRWKYERHDPINGDSHPGGRLI